MEYDIIQLSVTEKHFERSDNMGYIIKFQAGTKPSYLAAGQVQSSWTLTTDITKAFIFKTDLKAKNLLRESLPATFPHKNKAVIEEYDEPEKTVETVEIKTEGNGYKKIDLEKFRDDFNQLSQQLRDINDNKKFLDERLSELDRKITDIEHYLEFYTFNACDGYKLAKGLKEILKERRSVKNQMKLIQILNSSTCAGMMMGVAGEKVDKAILGDYEYTPRILKEMFEGKVEKKLS